MRYSNCSAPSGGAESLSGTFRVDRNQAAREARPDGLFNFNFVFANARHSQNALNSRDKRILTTVFFSSYFVYFSTLRPDHARFLHL